jgi:predicted nucleic acid-binding protein
MGTLDISDLPDGALLLVDAAPIIYMFEEKPLAARFRPIFEAHASGAIRFAISAITISEVLTGPLQNSDESLARRYRSVLESWQVVALDADIAETAARLRATLRLKLADAIQAASALAVNASALLTHDRDFSRLRAVRVIS